MMAMTTAMIPCCVSSPETFGPTTSIGEILDVGSQRFLDLGYDRLLRRIAALDGWQPDQHLMAASRIPAIRHRRSPGR